MKLGRAAAVILAAAMGAAGVKAGDPPPIKIFATPPAAVGARMSPDGTKVAVIASYQGRQVLYVHSLVEGGKDSRIVRTGDLNVRWVRWKDDKHLIASVFKATDRLFRNSAPSAHAITRLAEMDDSGEHVAWIGEPQGGFALKDRKDIAQMGGHPMIHPQIQDEVVSMMPQTPGHILQLVVDKIFEWGTRISPALYSVDVETGKHELVDAGDERIWGYEVDSHGVARLGKGNEGLDVILYDRAAADKPWHEYHRTNPNRGEIFHPLAFVPNDPGLLYVLSNAGPGGKSGLWTFDLASRSFVKLIDEEADPVAASDVREGVLIGYTKRDGMSFYLDPAWQADFLAVNKAVKGGEVGIVDRSADGTHVLVEAYAPHKPKVWWVLDKTGKSLALWPAVEEYPDMPAELVSPVKEVEYTARDGLVIPAHLTLPVGYKEGAIAFVVLPHGGPNVCEERDYDYESQFLASRGYGVLRPQYRGSTCKGPEFEAKGFKQWGFAMQDDVTDGTRWLIDQKYADPKRICIVGGSYGGYAALMGAEKEPGLYRCAAAWAPVTDLFELRKAIKNGLFHEISLDRMDDDDTRLDFASPALHAEKIQAPILLMHGKLDFTVNVSHSHAMENALRGANRPVEAIYLEQADHYREDYDARVAWLSALDRFLGAQLGKP